MTDVSQLGELPMIADTSLSDQDVAEFLLDNPDFFLFASLSY